MKTPERIAIALTSVGLILLPLDVLLAAWLGPEIKNQPWMSLQLASTCLLGVSAAACLYACVIRVSFLRIAAALFLSLAVWVLTVAYVRAAQGAAKVRATTTAATRA